MKKSILIFTLTLITLNSIAQKVSKVKKANSSKVAIKTFPVKGVSVTVTDWGSIGNWYMDNYWVSNKAAIVSQIGTTEFEDVKLNGDENKWPNVFKERLDKNSNDITAEKFKDLKLVQIAKFTNTVNGKKFDEMVILRVSRNDNANLFQDSDWFGNIYFVIKASAVAYN